MPLRWQGTGWALRGNEFRAARSVEAWVLVLPLAPGSPLWLEGCPWHSSTTLTRASSGHWLSQPLRGVGAGWLRRRVGAIFLPCAAVEKKI